MRLLRRHRRRLAVAASALGGVLLAGGVAFWVTWKPPLPPPPVRPPAEVLCDPTTPPEGRARAAQDASRAGTLRRALEQGDCVPAGRAAGLAALRFVWDQACAADACLDLLLRSPRDPESAAMVQGHREPVAQALAARACELALPGRGALLRALLGPAGAVVSTVAQGRLDDAAAPALQGLLESRDPLAVRLLGAIASTSFCNEQPVDDRTWLAALLLEALRIAQPEPVDLPRALRLVDCAPLQLLAPKLGLDQLPRLAEAAAPIADCGRFGRLLRLRALGYAGSRQPSEGHAPAAAGPARAIDRRVRLELPLPPDATAPAVALLTDGKLRAVAYTSGPGGRVCGAPALAAFDEQGRRRIELDPSGLRFLDAKGTVRVRLEAQAIRFLDAAGREQAAVPTGPYHGVRLVDAGGKLRARASWKPEALQLRLLDGETTLAQLIVDGRGAQLQVGAETLDSLPEETPCAAPAVHGGTAARRALVTAAGAFPLRDAPALLPPLDLDERTAGVELPESWEGPGLRLSGLGAAARTAAPR